MQPPESFPGLEEVMEEVFGDVEHLKGPQRAPDRICQEDRGVFFPLSSISGNFSARKPPRF